MNKLLKKFGYISYLVLLALTILYVRKVLNTDTVKTNPQKKEEIAVETKVVKAELYIKGLNELSSYDANYRTKVKNIDSIYDVFDQIRDDGNDFYYEITDYLYGTEIDNINNVKAPEGYKWQIIFNDNNVTNTFKDVILEKDSKIYILLQKV